MHVDSGGNTPQAWSSDGKWLVYLDGMRPDTKSDIWVMSLSGEAAPRALVRKPDYDHNPAISPDSHWLAYVRLELISPDGQRFLVMKEEATRLKAVRSRWW